MGITTTNRNKTKTTNFEQKTEFNAFCMGTQMHSERNGWVNERKKKDGKKYDEGKKIANKEKKINYNLYIDKYRLVLGRNSLSSQVHFIIFLHVCTVFIIDVSIYTDEDQSKTCIHRPFRSFFWYPWVFCEFICSLLFFSPILVGAVRLSSKQNIYLFTDGDWLCWSSYANV